MSNKFSNTVEKVNRLLGKAKESAETVQILYEKGDMQEAYCVFFSCYFFFHRVSPCFEF